MAGAWLALLAAALVPLGAEAGQGRCPSGNTIPLPPPGSPAANTPEPLAKPWEAANAAPPAAAADYRHRLRPTAYGWPRLDHWCVWVEPAQASGPAARWEQPWLEAVDAALGQWSRLVPITRVESPEQAQVRIWRRRPPLRGGRASHGRAELMVVLRQHPDGNSRPEPLVQVSLGTGQRQQALQATALHELGHAFGLWGHSDQPGDAMAAVPGPNPVLELSLRDRATFRWLQQQPGLALPLELPRARGAGSSTAPH
jgi:hypothetical protein